MNTHLSMSDEKLIQFYLNDNPNAQATLTELYKDRIYCCIYTMVQDKYVADEIFREAFIQIINEMMAGKTPVEGNTLKWATQIAQTLCLSYNTKICNPVVIRNSVDISDNGYIEVQENESKQLYHENHGKLKSMINMLPEFQKNVIVMNHYAGLSISEIADSMKCSLNTALSTLQFGLNNLRKLMMEKEIVLR